MSLLLLFSGEYADSLFSDSVEESTGTAIGSSSYARAEWTFVLADSSGVVKDVLDPGVVSAELTLRRSEACTLNLEFQGDDSRASNVIQQLTLTKPLVYAYRDGRLVFAGFVSAVRESASEDLTMDVTVTDALGSLQYRLTSSDVEEYDESASNLIAGTLSSGGSNLLAQANATGATGLIAGAISGSIGVETFSTSRDVVYDKVREISTLTNGPDLRVKPKDGSSTFGVLDVGALYTDSAVLAYFGYGGGTTGNLTSFDWEITPPATRVISIGSEVEGLSTVDANVTAAEARVGVWQAQVASNDLYLESDCINAANAAVRLDWTVTATFTPDPAVSYPRPIRDYNVGDLVSLRALRGSIAYNGSVRVREIGISIDDSGVEVDHRVEVELGGPDSGQQADATGLTVSVSQDASVLSSGLTDSYESPVVPFTPVMTGGVTQEGTTFTKSTGTTNWDAQVYSVESYTTKCSATATAPVASPANPRMMFGLNSDPTTNASFLSLDYAFYVDRVGNRLDIYESGSLISFSALVDAASPVLVITYDGTNVTYLKDGVVLRTVARGVGAALYLDSSYYDVGGAWTNVAFTNRGPYG